MKAYHASHIRNVALIGHGGEGKTTLVEAMLLTAGQIDRMGKTDDGTTQMDYDQEEVKRHISISVSLAPIEWNDHKLNLIDAPGYFDFEGEVVEALSVAEGAVIVLGAVSGLTVGAEKAWDLCKARALPRIFVVNRMDTENANFARVVEQLEEKYGSAVVPVQWPIMQNEKVVGYVDLIDQKARLFNGKSTKDTDIPAEIADKVEQYHDKLVEAAAENEEELLDKFFEGIELTRKEIIRGLNIGVHSGVLAPILASSAITLAGVASVMDNMIHFVPSPDLAPVKKAKNLKNDEDAECKCDENAPFSAQVFKSVADPFVGKVSLFKVYSGTLTSGMTVLNTSSEKTEKIGSVLYMRGKKTDNIDKLFAGDIGATSKLQNTSTGDTLCDSNHPVQFADIPFPKTAFSMAIGAKTSGEEDKVFSGLGKLREEDPTFILDKDAETGEMLISGLGEMHLDVICGRLKNKFNVEAKLETPKVAYRETIRKSSKAQGRHKKQSGGSGQFGDVWVQFDPITDGSAEFEFVDKVVGGVVPRNFIPAVEKGLREAVKKGVLTGYPMINIRCTLYDGSYHAVDSNEMAFRTAARLAYKKGAIEANPVLLEPINHYDIYVPDEYMGDVIGDINRRRGRIMGMNPTEDGKQQIVAEVPAAEMFKYATDLRSMTQSRGRFDVNFERYEEVPSNIAQKTIEKAKQDLEADDE